MPPATPTTTQREESLNAAALAWLDLRDERWRQATARVFDSFGRAALGLGGADSRAFVVFVGTEIARTAPDATVPKVGTQFQPIARRAIQAYAVRKYLEALSATVPGSLTDDPAVRLGRRIVALVRLEEGKPTNFGPMIQEGGDPREGTRLKEECSALLYELAPTLMGDKKLTPPRE